MRGNKSMTHLSIFFESSFYFFVLFFLFVLTFRSLRGLFPLPEIPTSKSVGYSHYFGYPFYFDNFALYLLIFSPILCFFLTIMRRKYFR